MARAAQSRFYSQLVDDRQMDDNAVAGNQETQLAKRRPAMKAGASRRIRTADPLITNAKIPEHNERFQQSGHLVVRCIRVTWRAGFGHNSDTFISPV